MPRETSLTAADEQPHALTWQKHLKGIPVPEKGAHLKGAQAIEMRTAVCKAYRDGGSLRDISDFIGRSFGNIRKIVKDAGLLRHPGAHNKDIPNSWTSLEWAVKILRDLATDGTLKPHHKVPELSFLASETGVSRKTLQLAALKLQMDGLLLVLPGRGVVVTDPKNPPKGDSMRVRTGPGRWETWPIPDQTEPGVEYLKKTLIAKIEGGSWRAGESVPNRAEIRSKFGGTKNAVLLALDSLEQSGHLVRRESKLYVNDFPGAPSPEIVAVSTVSTPASAQGRP